MHSASVLVVEDEPLVREYVSDILGQSGFDVIAASSGEEALSRIAEGGVCAVVSDVAMPGRVNGFELARRVREECPRTGVVLRFRRDGANERRSCPAASASSPSR